MSNVEIPHSIDERVAATAVAALCTKRDHEGGATDEPPSNKMRMTEHTHATTTNTMNNGHNGQHSAHRQYQYAPAPAPHHQQPQQQQQQLPVPTHHQQAQVHHQAPPTHHAPNNRIQKSGGIVHSVVPVASIPAGTAAATKLASAPAPMHAINHNVNVNTHEDAAASKKPMRPYPYFFYEDFSSQTDPDPLTPLTQPGRVPNFVAKMHAILSRPDLADVVAWMPHGRSWRVLKPREFEIRVIPTYFEHAKFSSFIRQANGWGFRRITQGRDRNSYYHEMFLRGLPHLCKMMKRPGVSEKQAADPEHEPDLYKISEEFPIPEKAEDDSVMLQCTLQGGPKARMPIYLGAFSSGMDANGNVTNQGAPDNSNNNPNNNGQGNGYAAINPTPLNAFSPHEHNAYQNSADSHIMEMNQFLSEGKSDNPASASGNYAQQYLSTHTANNYNEIVPQASAPAPVADNNSGAPPQSAHCAGVAPGGLSNVAAAAFQASSAASQFAAGFAAATALSHQQLRNILQSIASQQGQNSATMQQVQQAAQQEFAQAPQQAQAAQQQYQQQQQRENMQQFQQQQQSHHHHQAPVPQQVQQQQQPVHHHQHAPPQQYHHHQQAQPVYQQHAPAPALTQHHHLPSTEDDHEPYEYTPEE